MKPSKFKTPLHNRWKTRELFVEIIEKSIALNQPPYLTYNPDDCPYWLMEKHVEGDKRPILHEEFIKLKDVTGIRFANKFLGGYEHLKALLKCSWFKDQWDKWQEELFVTIQAEQLEKIIDISLGDGATALSAAKYLANKEWERSATVKKRGRPSKEEVQGALKNDVKAAKELQEDYQRMLGTTNMTVIQGGRA